MQTRTCRIIAVVFFLCGPAFALGPAEILVIANKDLAASQRIARYYCRMRDVPEKNIIGLSLGVRLNEQISRSDYDKWIAGPIRAELFANRPPGRIKCLLTTYGVPIKVGRRGTLTGMERRLAELKKLAEQEKERIQSLEQSGLSGSIEHRQRGLKLNQMRQEIDRISGTETNASVDSELSMLLFGPYDLHRWQPNTYKDEGEHLAFRTLMVSRLDGPDYTIVKGLLDKALAAERAGLKGTAYIDSRGIAKPDVVGHYDQSLRDLAMFMKLKTDLPVEQEPTEALFAPGSCPRAAVYCGWYSLRKYVDAFDFVDGAVGCHISSFGADNLRDPNSTNWCGAMLRDGITATMGAVAEPYLHAFPEPRAFFTELLEGRCLVEAYYRTNPFNSWQMVLIGDPLYTPFARR